MKTSGILRIQAFAARQSAPVEGVTITVSGNGFTAQRTSDSEGNTADLCIETPACRYSLQEGNTTVLPYAVCDLTAAKDGYRTVRIEGVQIFPGQVTLAQPEMIPTHRKDGTLRTPRSSSRPMRSLPGKAAAALNQRKTANRRCLHR